MQGSLVRSLVSGVAVLTALIAITVLGGWLSETDVLTRVVPGGARMVPATALGFLLYAAALGFSSSWRSATGSAPGLFLAPSCAIAVLLLGVQRLVTYAVGADGFEFLGLSPGVDSTGTPLGHMSPGTATDFVLLGAAFLLRYPEKAEQAFQIVTLLALLIGWLGLIRYLYGGEPLLPFAAMALHTAVLFVLLSLATLTLRTDASLMALILGSGAGGATARRLLPTVVLLPLLLGWIPAYAQHRSWIGPEAGLSLLAVLSVIVFGVLIWTNAVLLERADHRGHQEQAARQRTQAELYSQLQRAYEDLRQSQQRAVQEERLRALGQMASGIAHDINNALAPATLYLDILREHDKQMSETSRERLALVQRALEAVANTVGRMREFYRRGSTEQEEAPVQVNPAIEHVIALTRARWDDMPKEQGFVIQVQSELFAELPDILGSSTELRDACTNLLLNAVDAMPRGGLLILRTFVSAQGRVCIEVADTGIGMDTQTRLRCLEPFFTTKGDCGSGLGLAMVYGMVSRYSGDIEIDSTPGVGTRITLSFAPAPSVSGAAAAAAPE